MSAYDAWKTTDSEGERRQAEADADWEAFEAWSQGVSDEVFAEWCRDFLQYLKAGMILGADGWGTFEGWLFEKRWPAERKCAA